MDLITKYISGYYKRKSHFIQELLDECINETNVNIIVKNNCAKFVFKNDELNFILWEHEKENMTKYKVASSSHRVLGESGPFSMTGYLLNKVFGIKKIQQQRNKNVPGLMTNNHNSVLTGLHPNSSIRATFTNGTCYQLNNNFSCSAVLSDEKDYNFSLREEIDKARINDTVQKHEQIEQIAKSCLDGSFNRFVKHGKFV